MAGGGRGARLDRAGLAAAVAGALIGVATTAHLAASQAISRDEVSTVAAIRPAGWAQVQVALTRSADRLPEAYYDLAWVLKPVTGDAIAGLRGPSVVAWGAACLLLGLIGVGRRWPWPAVLVAATLPTASGLGAMGSYARPYAMAFACFCGALAVWDRARARPRSWQLAVVFVGASAATALHLGFALAVVLVLVAELWHLWSARDRSPVMALALAASIWPVLVISRAASRTIDAVQAVPMSAHPGVVPAWYASTLLTLLPAIVVGTGAIVVVLGRRPSRAAALRWGRTAAADPLAVAAVLLVAVLPLALAIGSRVAGLSYLHRYALGALAGLAVAGGFVTTVVERRRRWAALAICLAVVAGVPLALIRADDDRPSAGSTAVLADQLGLDGTERTVVVRDAYVYGLLEQQAPAAVRARTVLGGPSDVIGLEPDVPLGQLIEGEGLDVPVPGSFVLVTDRGALPDIEARGGLAIGEELGSARLAYQAIDRDLVAVEVHVVPPG